MSGPDRTYWDIVRSQFAKHRTAVWALRFVVALFLLAIWAPVLATSTPFMFREGQGPWEFPWFADLLNQTVFPNGVDLFFNLLLIFFPVLVVVWFLRRHKWAIAVFAVLFLYAFGTIALPDGIVESSVGKKVFLARGLRYSKPKVDWKARRAVQLDLVLANEKTARMERRVADDQEKLRAIEEGLAKEGLTDSELFNLEADLMSERKTLERHELSLAGWQEKKTAAEEAAADPEKEITAIMPPIGYHHNDNDEERVVDPPTFSGWGASHFLGTDKNGRDVAARLLYGIRVSLTIGVIAVSIYCTIGAIIGAIMGYFGGWVDMLGMRFVEIMICFPVFAFVLILVAVFQSKNIFLVVVAIAVVSWTTAARLIRGQFMQERGSDYVTAARALGIPTRKIVFRHVLPNAIHPLFVTATFGVAAAILTESALAFLGLGDPNVPSWGQILLEGRETMKMWLIFAPGAAIFLTVTVLNLVGEGLRDALDPKLRQ